MGVYSRVSVTFSISYTTAEEVNSCVDTASHLAITASLSFKPRAIPSSTVTTTELFDDDGVDREMQTVETKPTLA